MKKTYLILLILLCVLTAGLFPLDLFVFRVPTWLIYAMLAADAAALVLFFIKGGAKVPAKVLAVFLAALTAAASLGGIYIDPYFNSINFHSAISPTLPYDTLIPADKACEDIDYVIRYLWKDHPACQEGYDAPVIKVADQLKSDILSAGSITVNKLAAGIESALSQLGDAHTCAYTHYAEPLYLKHYYKWKKDGWRITAVNGLTIKELLAQCSDLFSFEAESWELEQMKNMLVDVQGLDYLGFSVQDGITYTFENDAGEVLSETYHAEDYVTFEEYIAYNGADSTKRTSTSSFVGFTVDEDRSLAILTLDECIFNDEYVNCLRDMFTQVKEKGVKNVAVDLRSNGGGSDRTAVEFIRYLDTDRYRYASETMRLGHFNTPLSADHVVNERYSDLTFTGSIYVLSSSASFSSAMLFTQYIKDNGLGTIIGEPPGNDPNGYGETAKFRTPNSGVLFTISTKRFYRADRNCTDRYVMPDIPCDADNALDALYSVL